jgi:hypothetical protein
MQNLSELSNIQLELELVKTNKSVFTHEAALQVLSNICEEKYGLSLNDLWEVNDYEWSKLQRLRDEYQSRINDLGLSAFESTLGQAE